MSHDTTLKDQILKEIVTDDWVSFVGLARLPGFADFNPETGRGLDHPDYDNMVIWDGLSVEAETALRELKEEGKIHWIPGSTMSYMIDGGGLNLPIASRAQSYATPHWLPVYWRPGRAPEKLLKEAEALRAKQRAKKEMKSNGS